MKKLLLLALGLALVAPALAPLPAGAGGSSGVSIEGKRTRKNARHLLYIKNLRGDKKCVYKLHGWTPDRLRVYHREGVITETWSYHELGKAFVFDMESRLVETLKIPVEDRTVR